MNADPYIRTHEGIKSPPTSFAGKLKYLGPGFILSASVVGSGELISTTTLGAQAGFVTLWVILVSCAVKVAIQLEFGKQAIRTGETVFTSLNRLGGPRFGKQNANWSLWTWLFLWLFKPLQLGGIIGGVAITLNMAFPSVSIHWFAILVGIVVAALVFKGYYFFIEKMSVVLMLLFTIFTVVAVFMLQHTASAFTFNEVLEGLQFKLPAASVGFAIAAFGLTGVGGDEIVAYNYWCLEKGYARFTGPFEDTAEWRARARGWIKVMNMDAILSLIIYTLVTAAFYLLGAAVLYKRGEIPWGFEMIEVLSRMYTGAYGAWAKGFFLFGSFIVLFSTLFSALAARTRIFSDLFGQLGWIDFFDRHQRRKTIAILAWVFPVLWIIALVWVKLPVLMVTIGGIITFFMLLIIVYAGLHFRHRQKQYGLESSKFYDVMLWISCVSIFLVGFYGLVSLL
ncbi:Mn2+ and Fe2+ transporters of the NRAMP family [Mariniphaga anaerophila]|uniref:Mn2+ and Fe2+ transporters of the NRAMP family n=1 Tax=Mariniphaga anaerophila TaxID=1484053 RepID=A0A1M4WHC4_9BACT|nr:Nramp family divalent metal transporter [Mariniphaga anaerophila]SHE80701.1 Mn2+ and Fe2+ transporters of the NRAMP family [Mariniphaga anaerophila]